MLCCDLLLTCACVACPQVCALHVTDAARTRITKAGGKIITFEELAQTSPTGKKTVLIQG